MKVRDLIEELHYYDLDGEVVFELDGEVNIDNVMAYMSTGCGKFHLNGELEPEFMCDNHNDGGIRIDLGVKDE